MALPTICILLLAITAIGKPTHGKRQKKEETLSLREVEKWFQKEFDEMVATCDQRMKDIEARAKCEKCPNPITKEDLNKHCEAQAVTVSALTTDLPMTQNVYHDCQDALEHGQTGSGIYLLDCGHVNFNFNRFTDSCVQRVFCEQRLDGGGWLVFQVRKDGSVNFTQDWNTYKSGFGSLSGEFWLGNKNIYELTKDHHQQLKIELESSEGEVKYADYNEFWVAGSSDNYRLHVAGYSSSPADSPPGDAMAYQNGSAFTTWDADHDMDDRKNCAAHYRGGWWFYNCHHAYLNGVYGSVVNGQGINWLHWKGHEESMKSTRMMFRRRP